MPAIRTSAMNAGGHLQPYESILKAESSSPTLASQNVPVEKKRRSPNAFFLFRSYFIANKLYPSEITHQADVSRYIAVVWRNMAEKERYVFFKKAEEEKRRYELEGPPEIKKKVRVRTRKASLSKKRMNRDEMDLRLDIPQNSLDPDSLIGDDLDLFLSSLTAVQRSIDDLPFFRTQYDWNSQPSRPASTQYHEYVPYSRELIQGSSRLSTPSVCDTTSDYAKRLDLNFLISSEIALLSNIVDFLDLSIPYTEQVPYFDFRHVHGFL